MKACKVVGVSEINKANEQNEIEIFYLFLFFTAVGSLTCKSDMKIENIGCFKDNRKNRALPKLVSKNNFFS